MQIIDSFRKPYSFLSNFSKTAITLEDILYSTLEQAYQAAKTHDVEAKKKIAATQRPDWAKRMGKRLKLREDWDDVKLGIMRELLNLKFQDEKLALKLIATGDAMLVEGNHWHDNYWGSCTCEKCAGKGQNHLGKLLMEIREKLLQPR